jgi:hypothetical protein
MKKMQFIRDLSKKKKVVAESLSYEDALLARLEKEADRAANIDKIDTVTLDVPLLIRVFELVREDVKTDMDLHNLVERMLSIKDKGVLTMDDYETISSAQASPDSGQMPKSTDENIDMSMLKMLAGIKR